MGQGPQLSGPQSLLELPPLDELPLLNDPLLEELPLDELLLVVPLLEELLLERPLDELLPLDGPVELLLLVPLPLDELLVELLEGPLLVVLLPLPPPTKRQLELAHSKPEQQSEVAEQASPALPQRLPPLLLLLVGAAGKQPKRPPTAATANARLQL